MFEKNVADAIKDEYQNWNKYDKVFISSPTGTGKTYFILHVLLPYVSQQGKRILYLVNRRILKEQLESEISSFPFGLRESIRIELYQTIEIKMSEVKYDYQDGTYHAFGYSAVWINSNDYDFVVCDECHYFLADSNYNTDTGLSFRWLQDMFSSKIRIFLSATIDDIKEYIMSDDEKRRYWRTNFYGFYGKNTIGTQVVRQGKTWEYVAQANYDHLNVHIINKEDGISELVMNGKGKWLIFVDNINFGEKLKKELEVKFRQLLNEEDDGNVVMISSDFEASKDSTREVNYIKKDNRQSAKVLITTSVMDNGISLKDIQLRNIILIADTEVEFMQMLGRKRKDGKKVDLYIYRQSRAHFSNRLEKLKKAQYIAEDYYKDAKKALEEPIKRCSELRGPVNWDGIQILEQQFIDRKHKQIMQDIDRQKIDINDVNAVFHVYDGRYYLNLLSFNQIERLVQYYYEILERFEEEGEDAFLKEQLRWIDKSDKEIEDIVNESRQSREEKSRKIIFEKFNEVKDNRISKNELIALKKEVKDYLLILVKNVEEDNREKKTIMESLKKDDRPISKKNMDFLYTYCGIPFTLEVEKANNSTEAGENDTAYIIKGMEK